MKVHELIDLLTEFDKEAPVLVRLDGAIYPTAPAEETGDYNDGQETNAFYIVTDRN